MLATRSALLQHRARTALATSCSEASGAHRRAAGVWRVHQGVIEAAGQAHGKAAGTVSCGHCSTTVETNFVDVVPQVKRLRLSLNLSFHEIDDPKGLRVDVSNVGRWGNGDVEVGLSSSAHLPYVMGRIRQAFDRQMSDQLES
jgi:predicted transport protein